MNEINTDIGLSKDNVLSTIRKSFYDNVFARNSNPDDLIKHEFTEQLKHLSPKIQSLSEKNNSNQGVKKHG